ncbi:MAG TPA: DUF4382 domain-containing protein [Cyclobacteriaceae bacterium]|nr:DUF4382 domain-containing protein [Cyclobacteriaceae bacterium]
MRRESRIRPFSYFIYLPVVLLLVFAGCQSDDTGTARLKVTLTDLPGDYDSVNVDILGVSVHSNENASESDGGWTQLENSNVGVVNLLEYTDGAELTLADLEYPTGRISQIRLLLGDNNTVWIDSTSFDLETPSAMQSGLKLLVNETLIEGVTYKFTLDFDAARSVIHTGNDNYILKPVIKVITEAVSGAISGVVNPADENVAVFVLDGEDTVATSYAPAGTADYLVGGVPAGTFSVSLDPGDSSLYDGALIENVNVTLGNVTDAGTTDLQLK